MIVTPQKLYGLIFLFAFGLISSVGVLALGGPNPLPAATLFEVVVLLGFVFLAARAPVQGYLIGATAFSYVLFSIMWSVFYREDHILDFLLVYKVYIYIGVAAVFCRENVLSIKQFNYLSKFLLLGFLAKYMVSFLFGLDERPKLYKENNFELMLCASLFYLRFIIFKEKSFAFQLAFLAIFFFSGSRSGIVIALVVLIFINFNGLSLRRACVAFPLVLLGGAAAYFVLAAKLSSGVENVDRYVFMMIFLQETSDWGLWQWLFGAERITALNAQACGRLSYYVDLFSAKDDGSCYSVILHSYLLRLIFDHGVFVALITLSAMLRLLVISGYSFWMSVGLLSIPMVSSLSVSAFNSVFFMLGFCMALFMGRYVFCEEVGKPYA